MKGLPVRKNIRLKGYDYSQAGVYFITICVKGRHEMFGQVSDGQIKFTEHGLIAERNLINIPIHVNCVQIDKYIVMPNHVHMILIVDDNVGTRYIASEKQQHDDKGTPYMASLHAKSKQTVPRVIQQYKASVTRDTGIFGLWQPRFHDHIIRDEVEYSKIWQYIDENPMRWTDDIYFSNT